MRFASPLIRGTLVRRYKRFLADVMLEDGREVTAHCANPGAMLGLNAPGTTVWLEATDGPRRKLGFAWRLVELDGGHFAGIDTTLPNRLVAEALAEGRDPGARRLRDGPAGGALRRAQPDRLPAHRPRPARRLGRGEERALCRREGDWAEFPDSVTARGARHLRELAADGGGRAAGGDALRGAAHRLRRASASPPTSTRPMPRAFAAARAAGVEAIAHATRIDPRGRLARPGRCRWRRLAPAGGLQSRGATGYMRGT